MYKFNLYKIKKEREIDLAEKFSSVGLERSSDKKLNGVSMCFYFAKSSSSIWWADLYKDFFSGSNELANQNYFGALVITCDDYCYVISLGKTHFYLKEFCELDFGIEIGTRLIDDNHIDMKNSRLFGGSRRKSIVTYQSNTSIEVDSGEAINFLKGKTTDQKWGKKIDCGNSVTFNIKDMRPTDLPEFIEALESELKKEPRFAIPYAVEVQDKKEIQELDKRLVDNLINNNLILNIETQDLSGVEFVFLKEYSLFLNGRRNFEIDVDGSIEDLTEVISRAGIELSVESINDIKIKAVDESNKGFTRRLKYFIDYIDEDNYFLQDDKWVKFNDNYVDYLINSVSNIEFEVRKEFNFNSKEYKVWKSKLSEEEKKSGMQRGILMK
ncbi:DUF6119 family protein [Numidum massiliense]|uniref:DUF6119 family protein n=1 Tax=Numidum massiliense TaxID=1522315 RepID=UPI0006D5ABA9|nr:DUF6119 family protein [Numidum massiliense]